MMATLIRVLLVDAFAVVRQGVTNFLHKAPDMVVVGETPNSLDVLAWCRSLQPDVVLFNPEQNEKGELEFIRALHRCCPGVRTIALGEAPTVEQVHLLLEAGVSGYLLKNTSAEEVIQAIRAVYQGQGALAPEVTQLLVNCCADQINVELTPREWEVLQHLIRGLHNEEIAGQLVVTVATVKAHLHHLFEKLGVSNRTQAVAFALQHRVMEPPHRAQHGPESPPNGHGC
jgi:DNA-binding NarL/FixJ family response regulator